MKIAQVAPLFETVPPQAYGGTERIISCLTEELVSRGHDVTLFAAAGSQTTAKLVAARDCAMRLDTSSPVSPIAAHLAMLCEVRKRIDEFDIFHFHLSHFIHFPMFERFAERTVTTPHGRLDYRDLRQAYEAFPPFPMISISKRQRLPLPDARWVGNVYHGIPAPPVEAPPDATAGTQPYLVFLGRFSRDKRPDRAIEIARRAGMKLKMAAKIGEDDRQYFREHVEPAIDGECVEYLGEVDEAQKNELLANASALLFPIDWPEPFGLVLIEAFAFGTPVVAWPNGAVPELVEHGRSGFVVNSIDEAVAALARLDRLNRAEIRCIFGRRFAVSRMVDEYEQIYARQAGRAKADAA